MLWGESMLELGYVISVLVVLVLAIIAVVAIARLQRRGLRKKLLLEIANQGNLRSRYDLKAEDPTSSLRFEFSLEGDTLPDGSVVGVGRAVDTAEPQQATPSAAPASPGQAAGGMAQSAGDAKERADQTKEKAAQAKEMAQEKGKQAQDKAKKAMGISGAISETLFSLGMILPRSIGAPLLNASSRMRRTESSVARVQQTPGTLSVQAARLKATASTTKEAVAPMPQPDTVPALPQMPATEQAQPEMPTAPPELAGVPGVQPQAAPIAHISEPGWAQTPYVQPGESLELELTVAATRTSKARQYPFAVISRAVEQEAAPLVSEEGSIQIRGIPWILRILPYLAILALAIVAVLLAFWLVNNAILS
jgi:hypothetical protein